MTASTTIETPQHVPTIRDPADALAEQLLGAMIGAMELFSIHVGRETGLYAALADRGTATIAELADAADLDHRYVDEWLHQQAAAGLVVVDDAAAPRHERLHVLPNHVEEVLLDDNSLRHLGPSGAFLVGIGRAMPDLIEAFRTGVGVPYADYGADFRRAIASFNRPLFDNKLGSSWLPGIPVVHQALQEAIRPRILDVGAGLGASTLALARTYPHALVWGVDLDEDSVAEARRAAATTALADRVRFVHADALRFAPAARFDLVTWFESLHDTADPVAALANIRTLLAPGGHVLVADGKGEESFTAPAGPIERLLYGFSVLHCLPAAREDDTGHAHGLVVRPDHARGWFHDAGFGSVEVLDLDNDFWRFYLASA